MSKVIFYVLSMSLNNVTGRLVQRLLITLINWFNKYEFGIFVYNAFKITGFPNTL